MKLFINNEEWVFDNSFTINEYLANKNILKIKNAKPKTKSDFINVPLPQDWSAVKLIDDNNKIIFTGVLRLSNQVTIDAKIKQEGLNILATDIKEWLSSKYVNANFIGKSISEIVLDLKNFIAIDNFIIERSDISLSNTNDFVIDFLSFRAQTIFDILQSLSERAFAVWWVEYDEIKNKFRIKFSNIDELENHEDADFSDPDYISKNLIEDVTKKIDTKQYFNKLTLNISTIESDTLLTQTFLITENDTSFFTDLKIANIEFFKFEELTKNGVYAVFNEAKQRDDFNIWAILYYTKNNNELELNYQDLPKKLKEDLKDGKSFTFTISYFPIIDFALTEQNNEEINRVATLTNTSGVIEKIEKREDVSDSAELNLIQKFNKARLGKTNYIITIVSEKRIYEIGRRLKIKNQGEYIIKNITLSNSKTNRLTFTYELSSVFSSFESINFFDPLRRFNSQDSVDELVTNLQTTTDACLIWYDLAISVAPLSLLNIKLNSLLAEQLNVI